MRPDRQVPNNSSPCGASGGVSLVGVNGSFAANRTPLARGPDRTNGSIWYPAACRADLSNSPFWLPRVFRDDQNVSGFSQNPVNELVDPKATSMTDIQGEDSGGVIHDSLIVLHTLQPVTLRFADAVGEILTAGPQKPDLSPLPFRYYI